MAKYDVYLRQPGQGFLLDVQAELFADLNTRVVVPLLPLEIAPAQGHQLNPTFEIEGQGYSMVSQYISAVPTNQLKERVTNLSERSWEVSNAHEMHFQGF